MLPIILTSETTIRSVHGRAQGNLTIEFSLKYVVIRLHVISV